jgi:hypothetical protein
MFTEVSLYFFLSHDEGLLQNFLHFKGCIKFCCLYDGGSNNRVRYNKMSDDFRRATRSLVDIGKELAFIAKCLEDIQLPHNATAATACQSAREARSAAMRMSRHFGYVAYILTGVDDQETK